MLKLYTETPEQTERVGKLLGTLLEESSEFFFVAMYGDLGAGKTVFVRGLASILSPTSRVKSPTFTLVNEYRRGKKPLFHFDLYRISDVSELDGFGFDEYVDGGNCIAEWSENLGEDVPKNSIKVKLEKKSDTMREITVEAPNFIEEKLEKLMKEEEHE